jgi:8-oxo-dGTP pyrophosphatase MutT (NUDIX family)
MTRITVRAVIEHEGNLLLAKLKNYENDIPQDFYCTIGGSLNEGEPITEGLEREVIEETGIAPVIGRLLFVHQYSDHQENLEFFFLVENSEDFLNIDIGKTSHGVDEIAEIGFYDPAEVNVLPKFLADFDESDVLNIKQVEFYAFPRNDQ